MTTNESWRSSETADSPERKAPPAPGSQGGAGAPIPHRLTIDTGALERVNRALEAIRGGQMVILVDDEDRENEGDLTMAAEAVTPQAINFMAKHGRGLICLTLTEEQVDRLDLPMMQAPGRGGPPLGTAFTVSVEAASGVTTGISAADRAHTIRVAARPDAKPSDLVTPGHVFPLRARRGGVLVRTGQTEGSVDLARLAGLAPAGVICEIMNEDGTMARMPDLERFAAEHGLQVLTIADLVQYRLQTERLVRRVRESSLRLDLTGSTWSASVFEIVGEARQFLALVFGAWEPGAAVLTRVHRGSLVADLFASTPSEGGHNLRAAVQAIEAAGAGVVLYIPPATDLERELGAGDAGAEGRRRGGEAGESSRLREFGLGAQILAELGVEKLRLLSNSRRKIAGLAGFGLTIVEHVPIPQGPRA